MKLKNIVLGGWCLMVGTCCATAFARGPQLVPDYDRDGDIGATDREKALAGQKFTIWLNDDDDAEGTDDGAEAGDTNTDLHDVPGGNDDKDFADDKVNGRCDLLDFFPVLIEVKEVVGWDGMTWKLSSESVNVVFTGLDEHKAGSFHTQEVKALDGNTPLYRAAVTNLTEDGVELPSGFLNQDGKGVFLIEGRDQGSQCLTLRGYNGDEVVAEVTMNLDVKNVEDMYGWINLRDKGTGKREEGAGDDRPAPVREDADGMVKDNRHFVLVHGYNTNHDEARGNAAEFYKKLWQSGSDAMFTAVEWKGSQSQVEIFGLNLTPNYHVNVENAFLAARPFAEACRKLTGEKILVGHSLGNMLISAAIKDYGLDYTKYVMLNAAVAREAYDASAYDVDMVDEDWLGDEVKDVGVDVGVGVDKLTNHLDRASRWYRNFADHKYDPYEYRRKLAWRGRFANLPRTVNYYSQSDNILVNPDPHEPDPDKIIDRNDPEIYKKVSALLEKKLVDGKSIGRGGTRKTGFGFWAFSEKLKGTWLLDVVNDVLTNSPLFKVAQADAYKREGGWGENDEYDDDPEKPFDPANTRFTPFLDERMKTKGMLDILPAETERLRAQHLADAIPAESFAAGANPVTTLENVNEEDFIGENRDWPLYEGEEVHTNLWNHSAFREVAFYHTSKFYASLVEIGKPRVIIDTDLGSCMDDLFAVDLAARMHKAGKLDLTAVMMNRPDGSNSDDDPHGRGEFLKFADRYLASLGLGNLPLGTSAPLAEDRLPQTVFNPYWTLIYSNNVTGVGALMPTNRTPEEIATLPDAVTLYRRLLKGAPDKSVVICSTGFLTNLKELLESCQNYKGDDIASTGLELIAAKVKELRIMGGCFDPGSAPDGTYGAEYNFAGDPDAAKKVVEEWPTPVILSPWEVGFKLYYKSDDVLADFPLGTFDPVVRAAYTYWPDPGPDAMNRLWDPMTVLPLTEGETLVPLSVKGGISVDEDTGVTTFVPDPSSNRCYQVASNMNATAVMNRFREICRTGNPSLPDAVRCIKDAGVDYNGHDLTFKVPKFSLGAYNSNDVHMVFAFDGKSYVPDEVSYDPILEVFSVHFDVPAEDATAGNVYNGTLTITLENETIGPNEIKNVPTQIVQGAIDYNESEYWFSEFELEAPTNYVPETEMPERTKAIVETWFTFENPSPETDDPPEGEAQAAVRIVEDGAGGYKFQYYAFAGKADGYYYRAWHDFNIGGENAREIEPVVGHSYIVRMEGFYQEDARGEANTLAISVKDAQDNSSQNPLPQFVGNLVNRDGKLGGLTRLNSVEFVGDGEIESLCGDYCVNIVNANLARIDDDDEYATVADAVAAANGQPIRLLHAASWKPTAADVGTPVRFLNKSDLVLDLSGLPANAQAVWTDVDGNNGTLTLELVSADTVVYGTIRTAETGNPVAEAFAVKDGKYVYVGDEAGAAAFIEDGVTEIVDHRGKGMVMPGCTDGHSHYTMKFGLANMKGGVLFDMADDKTNVLKKVKAAADAAKAAGKTCIFGFGWSIVALRVEDPPTLQELDEASLGLSMVIFAQGGHHAYCNTECLKRCKILSEDGKTVLIPKIDGGLLELDEKDYPTGFVDERVTGYLMRMGGINFDEIVDDEVAEASIRASQELLLSTGYTTALEGWSNILHPSKFYEAAHRMDTNGVLKLVFPMTYEVEPWQTNMTEQIDYLDSLNKTYGTSHVLPEYLKVFMDGCVESMTGAMITPYAVPPYEYKSFWSVDRLAEITANCNAKGLTVHTHVMGDAAVKETTDAYIQGGDGTHRNCMVHLRHVRQEDYQRFADNNIACSAGFTWHVSSKEMDDLLKNFLDDEYIKHAYPMKSFFDAGVRVSSHSDFPANEPSPQDPFGIMQVALTGMVPNPAEDDKPFDTDELVTVEQVFQALTLNGAWQLGLENERGSIAVGKYADFVLADQDVFECEKTEIGKTKVVSTWFEGERVYQAGSKETPWKVGKAADGAVVAYTNGTDCLVIEGRGAMMDFATVGPWGTGVTAVDFGAQVTNIGANAFAGCTLTSLTMRGNPPALGGNNALSGVTKIVIREDALAKFEADPDWNAHAAKFESVPVCYDYGHIKTLAPFLHEVWYDDYTFDAKGETLAGVESFSCSSVRNGNFIGRNFDFFLDDKPEFVVHVAADPAKGRLASVAMAMHTGMREDGVTNGQYTASYDLLPNRTLDGINECGVAINQNVVAYDPEVVAGPGKEFTGTNPGAPELNISFVTRMVLDQATNAAHAVELIKSRNLFGMSVSGDILHYMISDKDETYVVEIITNTVVARHFEMMTNFAINWDNENARALTDADTEWDMDHYLEPSNLVVSAVSFLDATNALAKYYARHAEGVERFVRLRDNYPQGATFEGMEALMRRAQYSQSSTFATQPYWYSDRCSVEVDKKLTEAGYPAAANIYMLYGLKYYKDVVDPTDILEGSLDDFLDKELMANERDCLEHKDDHRKDNCGVWLTVHNTTYDISNRMFRVAVQEDYDHTFDIYLSDRPVEQPVTPGEALGPYRTYEKATNVAEKAVLKPSAEVEEVLTTEEVRKDYKSKFDFAVAYKSGEESGWYVEAMLTAAGSNDLVRSANTVTTNINLAAIAALVGETTTSMTLMGGITGFYYSLHVGDAVTNIVPDANEMNLNVLCGKEEIGKVTFPEVKKPSDAAGFFTVGASAGRGGVIDTALPGGW